MNNNACQEETKRPQQNCHGSSGILIAIVLYILLVIILSSLRGY